MSALCKGVRVEIQGLKNAKHLNNTCGTLLFQHKTGVNAGRWGVRCDPTSTNNGSNNKVIVVAVKPENLKRLDDFYSLNQRLEKEQADLQRAQEALRLVQQQVAQRTEAVEKTQKSLLEQQQVGDYCNASCVLDSRYILFEIFRFLHVKDLGTSVALTCQAWNELSRDNQLWKPLVANEWHSIPNNNGVVGDYRAFYKSQIQREVPRQRLTYPHCRANNNNRDAQNDYYLMAEFPYLQEETEHGPRTIMRSWKLDESLMTDRRQLTFENPICSCGEWRCDDELHNNAWLHLPVNATSLPFDIRNLCRNVARVKFSILRSSDGKVACLMDPDSPTWGSFAEDDDSNHPDDVLHSWCWQALRDVPNFDAPDEHDRTRSIGFQVEAAIECHEYEQETFVPELDMYTNFLRRTTSTDGYYLYCHEINHLIFGFVFTQKDNDLHHMAPPFQSACLTEYLDMAGVLWH